MWPRENLSSQAGAYGACAAGTFSTPGNSVPGSLQLLFPAPRRQIGQDEESCESEGSLSGGCGTPWCPY